MDHWFDWLIGLTMLAIIALIVYVAWINASSPEIELRKDQWECTEYRDYTTLTIVNKVLIPIQHHECQNWRRVR